jgi:hypothetical protein
MMGNDNFFMVYGEGQQAPTMKHENLAAAQREAERLSRNHAGIRFFVMMPVSVSQRVDVQTRSLVNLDDIIPF